jgi:hypothetical protein
MAHTSVYQTGVGLAATTFGGERTPANITVLNRTLKKAAPHRVLFGADIALDSTL